MKKFAFVILALCAVSFSYAQTGSSYIFVNSEKIFKSVAAYNEAITQLDDMSAQYRKNIETAYQQIEQMYNNYQAQKAYLSETNRATREDNIINREKEVEKYQNDVFGPEGELMKKRVEMIKPIQDKVFTAINKYAESNGYTMVIDIAVNQNILYYQPALDKTDAIINIVK